MSDADISLHDPFVAHIVSIAATIHLENSISQDRAKASASRKKFQTLLAFVQDQADVWRNAKRMVSVLIQALSQTLTVRLSAYEATADSSQATESPESSLR